MYTCACAHVCVRVMWGERERDFSLDEPEGVLGKSGE